MSEKNYLNETVVPRMPKSVSNEQLFVFVPVASGTIAGILKINDTDFYKNRLPELKIVESGTLDSTNKPYYNPLGYVRAGIIKAYIDSADKALQDDVDLKQDKAINIPGIEAKTVEGALTELDGESYANTESIKNLKATDEVLITKVNNLEQSAYIGETPIGAYPSAATLPTQEQLTAFVQQEVSRAPKLGDVVLFTQIVVDGTDKSYKFMYTETGWSNYVVSILEKLSNTPGTSETDGYTQKTVNGIVQNPNLLINPNFAINQRGETSYTGSTSRVYCVDRWHLIGNSTFETATKKVSLLAQYSEFWQSIENYKDLIGKTVTFSISVSNVRGNDLYAEVKNGNDVHITTDGIYTITTTVPESITEFGCGLYRKSNDIGATSCVVNWAKLEIGSVATEFSPPNIAEELPKCERYFLIRRGYSRALSPYALYQAYISFGTQMRVIPTSKVYAVNSSGVRVGTEKTIFNLTKDEIVDIARNPQYLSAYGCGINSSGALVQNNEYMFDIECDAEI